MYTDDTNTDKPIGASNDETTDTTDSDALAARGPAPGRDPGPERYAQAFVPAGTDWLSFESEEGDDGWIAAGPDTLRELEVWR